MINVNKNKKRALWNLEAEYELLDVWKQFIEKLRSTRRTFSVYEEMANELQKHGHDYTGGEVHIKVHNFTNRYKKDKRQIRGSVISESTWVHYAVVDKILGNHESVSRNDMDEGSILENLNGAHNIKPKVRKSLKRLKRGAHGVKEVRENDNYLNQSGTESEEPNPTEANSDDLNVKSENMSSYSENAVNYMAITMASNSSEDKGSTETMDVAAPNDPLNKTTNSILENLAVEKAKEEIIILKKEHSQRLKLKQIEHTRKLEIMNKEHELTVKKLKLEIELLKRN